MKLTLCISESTFIQGVHEDFNATSVTIIIIIIFSPLLLLSFIVVSSI